MLNVYNDRIALIWKNLKITDLILRLRKENVRLVTDKRRILELVSQMAQSAGVEATTVEGCGEEEEETLEKQVW